MNSTLPPIVPMPMLTLEKTVSDTGVDGANVAPIATTSFDSRATTSVPWIEPDTAT